MASIGHIAIGLAARRLYEQPARAESRPLIGIFVWSALAMIPDADVLGFQFGVSYGAVWGHRGATHSLFFAAILGVAGFVVAKLAKLPPGRTALFVAAVVASHGLLDTLTDGGSGVALAWPFSNERFFAPWRPIPVAPIGWDFLSERGLRVAAVELLMFAIPFGYGLWPNRSSARSTSR